MEVTSPPEIEVRTPEGDHQQMTEAMNENLLDALGAKVESNPTTAESDPQIKPEGGGDSLGQKWERDWKTAFTGGQAGAGVEPSGVLFGLREEREAKKQNLGQDQKRFSLLGIFKREHPKPEL